MHKRDIHTSGKSFMDADKALIMVHGRGAGSLDILALEQHLHLDDFTLVAPQATNNTWYPESFMAPREQNEPWLSSAMQLLEEVVQDLKEQGIDPGQCYFLGFSQGACLALEYTAQNATRYGGVIAFSGGLIGDRIEREHYAGDFAGTPVFMGSSDPDPHVPAERVRESAEVMKSMNAEVMVRIYDHMGHTINRDEIDRVNELFFS